MIFNNETLEIKKITAQINDYIEIISEDEKITFNLSFNREEFDVNDLELNTKTSIIKYLYWDVTIETKETYYLFDLTKDKVYLTKLDDNKYKIDIENPDIIYCPLNKSFDNLKITSDFSSIES